MGVDNMMKFVQSDKNNYKILGILIRSERINQGYSLRDLGSLAKISHTLISNIEKGMQTPTPDTLADIFSVLKLDFYDDPELLLDLEKYSQDIYNYIFAQDYEKAKELLQNLEVNEKKYLNSLGVVNYIILKCLFYSITNNSEDCIDGTIEYYEKVIDFFTDDQKQIFYFIKGLNHLNKEEYSMATSWFYKALGLGRKKVDVFIKQYNVVSLIKQYKFTDAYRFAMEIISEFEQRTNYIRAMETKLQLARIFNIIAKHDETEELVSYVYRFATRYGVSQLLDECAQLRATTQIRLRNFEKAHEFINQLSDQSSLVALVLKFRIAMLSNEDDKIIEAYNNMSKSGVVTSNMKVWYYTQIQAMSKVESLYNKEEYIAKTEELVRIAKETNDQEMIGLSHNYLIMHYHEQRSYKKALEIAEELLQLKKIRIEND